MNVVLYTVVNDAIYIYIYHYIYIIINNEYNMSLEPKKKK
jgi:hypothetical protein